jgi:hypothetical protein
MTKLTPEQQRAYDDMRASPGILIAPDGTVVFDGEAEAMGVEPFKTLAEIKDAEARLEVLLATRRKEREAEAPGEPPSLEEVKRRQLEQARARIAAYAAASRLKLERALKAGRTREAQREAERLKNLELRLPPGWERPCPLPADGQSTPPGGIVKRGRRSGRVTISPKPEARWRSRNAMIVAASRRGIPQTVIAARIGITRQRVQQILARAGEPPVPHTQRARPTPTRVATVCVVCGTVRWRPPSHASFRFCSSQCIQVSRRTAIDVQAALALRAEGLTWAAAGRRLGANERRVQGAVWRYLAESGQLTAAVVLPLWRSRHRVPRWHWLERATGYRLQP